MKSSPRKGRPTHYFESLIGRRFGKLVVISFVGKKGRQPYWRCLCDCGRIKEIYRGHLIRGFTKSCGCYWRDIMTTHAMTGTSEYHAWTKMKRRCSNPDIPGYYNYGGRGIKVCKRWTNSFAHFFADMGKKPTRRHEIDRKNNSRGYYPSNCRWVLPIVNGNNRRTNRILTADGQTKTMAEWARQLRCSRGCIPHRLAHGRSVNESSMNAGWMTRSGAHGCAMLELSHNTGSYDYLPFDSAANKKK